MTSQSPDGQYQVSASTWRAKRMGGGDRLTFRFDINRRGTDFFDQWEIPVPLVKGTVNYQARHWDYYSFQSHGSFRWSSDSKKVAFLVHGIEVSGFNTKDGSHSFQEGFLPVRKITLKGKHLPDFFLDLDSGQTPILPKELVDSSRTNSGLGGSPLSAWMRTNGLDFTRRTNDIALLLLDGVSVMMAEKSGPHARPQAFDLLSTTQVMAAVEAAARAYGSQDGISNIYWLDARAVYAFQTREGDAGLIEIVEEDKGIGLTRFRFKLVDPTSQKQAQISPSVSFGPVIERVVTDSIDLDSGIMEPFPQPLALRGGDWQVDALYEKGVFVFAVSTRLITLAGNEWVDLSPDRLRSDLENQLNPADPQLIMETAKLPVTFGFRTGNESIGILQVIGYSENPPGVKIRYKLVPQAKAPNSASLPARQTTGANKTAAGNSKARKPELSAPIEIDLPVIDRAGNALLDLDTGELLKLPEDLAKTIVEGKTTFSSAEFQDWAGSSGSDLVCESTKTPSLLQIGGATGLAGRLMDPDNGESVPAKIEQIKPQTVIRWAETIAPRVAELSSQGMWSHEPTTANIFKTREGGMGVLEIVGYTKNPRGVKIRYRVVRDIVTDTAAQAVPSSSIFGPQAQRTVTPIDANREGVVAFRFKDNKVITPPVALTGHYNKPATLGFTPELKEWMQASNMDLLLHLGQKSYDVLTLDMRDGFSGQSKTWDTVVPADIFPVLARLEALNTKQGSHGIFSGCGYRDGWSYVHGFRTRDGLVGYYQIRGVEDLDARGVEIRYKLVQHTSAADQSAHPVAFGDTLDVQVLSNERMVKSFLDLDTGKLLDAPEKLAERLAAGTLTPSSVEVRDWMRSSGADVVCQPSKPPLLLQIGGAAGLAGMLRNPDNGKTVAKHVDQVTVEEVSHFARGIAPQAMKTNPQGMWNHDPITANLFKTREGGMGVLEIPGFTENPPGVKIRYKLLQEPDKATKSGTGSKPIPARAVVLLEAAARLTQTVNPSRKPTFESMRSDNQVSSRVQEL